MKKERVWFIQFFSPGSFVANVTVQPSEDGDVSKVVWPESAYSFSMHTREDVVDGETRYEGASQQVGPMYFHPDSKVETLAQVRQNSKATRALISNMECNRWDAIIWSRWGNWPQPFDAAKCAVLLPSGVPA